MLQKTTPVHYDIDVRSIDPALVRQADVSAIDVSCMDHFAEDSLTCAL